MMDQPRDLIGYGANPPDPKWPNGARIALNFVMNYEEGSEPSIGDGETDSERGLTESPAPDPDMHGRDLAAEGMFAYGSRVGFWRLMRLFRERNLPMTVFGCALALERNPAAAAAIVEAGHDVCCHGWRWIKHYTLNETTEREHIRLAVESLTPSAGTAATAPASTPAASSSKKAASSTTATPTTTNSPTGPKSQRVRSAKR